MPYQETRTQEKQANMGENNEEHMLNQQIGSLESFYIKELTALGNQAVKMGLIGGHGYHEGKYEILCIGQIFLLSPEEALSYLKNLLKQHQT